MQCTPWNICRNHRRARLSPVPSEGLTQFKRSPPAQNGVTTKTCVLACHVKSRHVTSSQGWKKRTNSATSGGGGRHGAWSVSFSINSRNGARDKQASEPRWDGSVWYRTDRQRQAPPPLSAGRLQVQSAKGVCNAGREGKNSPNLSRPPQMPTRMVRCAYIDNKKRSNFEPKTIMSDLWGPVLDCFFPHVIRYTLEQPCINLITTTTTITTATTTTC